MLVEDPQFGGRDEVYFYLAVSLAKSRKEAEALPYFERLISEFEYSEHLDDARKRVQELKAQSSQ